HKRSLSLSLTHTHTLHRKGRLRLCHRARCGTRGTNGTLRLEIHTHTQFTNTHRQLTNTDITMQKAGLVATTRLSQRIISPNPNKIYTTSNVVDQHVLSLSLSLCPPSLCLYLVFFCISLHVLLLYSQVGRKISVWVT